MIWSASRSRRLPVRAAPPQAAEARRRTDAMAAAARIALVSGGNRGIGYEICRALAKHGVSVVLTAREATKGKSAVKALQDEGLELDFQRLDVTSCRSIRSCVSAVAERH